MSAGLVVALPSVALAAEPFALANSASFEAEGNSVSHVAANSLASIFNTGGQSPFTDQIVQASGQPLPVNLGGVRVEYLVFGPNGTSTWVALGLLYVSPNQINFLTGAQVFGHPLRIFKKNGTVAQRNIYIEGISAIGVFSANGGGQGPVNGVIVNDPVPLTNGNGEPNRVVFYTTGLDGDLQGLFKSRSVAKTGSRNWPSINARPARCPSVTGMAPT